MIPADGDKDVRAHVRNTDSSSGEVKRLHQIFFHLLASPAAARQRLEIAHEAVGVRTALTAPDGVRRAVVWCDGFRP